MNTIQLLSTDETYVKRFRLYGVRTTFKFNEPPEGVSEIEWLKQGFSDLVENMKAQASETDYLGFTLQSLNLKNKEPGYVAFRLANQVEGDILWEIFGGIIQSNAESIKSTDTFRVECTRVNLPVGSGGIKRRGFFNNFDEECKSRLGIVTIKNTDSLCLPRALVVGRVHSKYALAKKNNTNKLEQKTKYNLVRMDKGKRQTKKANRLMAKSRVEIGEDGAGLPELEKFQSYMTNYKITVYNYDGKGREVYFRGEPSHAQYKINLLFHKGHYNLITSLTGAFACQHYCESCNVPYERAYEHRCSSKCADCITISPPCSLEYEGITCPTCNRHFKNQICFSAHQASICKTVQKCKECHKLIFKKQRKSIPHFCGEVFCKICCDYKEENHKCYMLIDLKKPTIKDFLYIFFDFETRQDEAFGDDENKKVHKVNLCVSQQFCSKCIHEQMCDECEERTLIFREAPVQGFVDYVMEVRKKYRSVCVIAHNGQGYDFQFILKHIMEKTKFTPELIMRGTKIILLEMDNVKFIDSLSYFPMALAALPKAFDLPPEKKKGFFPHLFNTLENQNYKGPMPPKEYYCPDTMFEKTYSEFDIWYSEQLTKNYTFDFQKELIEYCISDVEILAQSCIKFRSLLLEQCNVDPFLESVTIASACNLVFRRNFLKPNTIGIIPKKGYRLVNNQSSIALQWLCWEESRRGVTIQHAGRDREMKISKLKVDGFDGSTIYEFRGCYFHGCPECFPMKRDAPLKDDCTDTLNIRYQRTLTKMEKLASKPYELVQMWECEFKKIKKDEHLEYLESSSILNTLPLDPRNAFFGGRTGNTKCFHSCAAGEEIRYVDVCSLYPYVCKYGKFPLGHPTVHVGEEECAKRGLNVEGLLKCKIVPPSVLYHPVLPMKLHEKLMFLLCRTCGENLNAGDCNHSDEEKALTGTWTMDEIRVALENGYRLVERYELWEYEVSTFETGGLFAEFINSFLKIKQEASGYPEWCLSEEDKMRYIDDYYTHEGIRLDSTKIKKNAGLRSLAKLMLVSFWGKFGQRENQSKATIIREPQKLFNLLTDPETSVNSVQLINDDIVLVNWQNINEVGETLKNANVVIAAYTTAQARLKLYEHLKTLQEQVIYYDTDSIIYIYKKGASSIPTGDFLGDMTDELAGYGPGSFIAEFVSGGPKTYGYVVYSTKDLTYNPNLYFVCKIKGLTLNMKTSNILNFSKLKEMILEVTSDSQDITESRIRRTKDRNVVTVKETKLFKITGPKRKREGEFDTLPYGFKK